MIHNSKKIGLLIFVVYLIINLFILKDYGLSWDYHNHYFAGLYHLGLKVPDADEPSEIPFTPPDPRLTVDEPFGPFTQVIPALSEYIFSDRLQILPFDIAYNLPLVFFGAAGVIVLYFFLLELFNLEVAVLGSLFLGLHPYYFGYLHNNMKDVPNAVAFAFSVWMFYRLVKFKNFSSLFFASLAFAFAFNVKINSVLVPVVCGIYYIFSTVTNHNVIASGAWRSRRGLLHFVRNDKIILLYFLLAPLFAIIVWWPFWSDPFAKLMEIPHWFSLNTYNMPVLYFGNIIRSGINIPVHYPYVYLAITTPLPLLLFFIPGLAFSLFFIKRLKPEYFLLLAWFILPLIRYLHPDTAAIDGVRHFLEVLFPLSAIVSIGCYHFLKKQRLAFKLIIYLLIFIPLISGLYIFHPYQTSFFNALIGGPKGADGKFDIDFWGTPQREAVYWLNKTAPLNSSVHIVMAQSTAALYLRPDLLKNLNKKTISDSDFTVLLNRQSFFGIYGIENLIAQKKSEGKIVFEKDIAGAHLVWVLTK